MKPTDRLISREDSIYNEIGEYIQSKESVVGIDAQHTHIIIIKKLLEREEKLDRIGKRLYS